MRRLAAAALLAALMVACDSPQEKQARYLERGVAHVAEGDDARAMVEFQNVLRLNPKNAEALFHIGQIHERAGRLPEAYAAYKQATAERPDLVPANVRLGSLALAVGDLDTAAAAAEAISKVDPGNAHALAMRGSLALRRDDIDAARDFATRALEAEPGNEDAVAVLAAADHRLGHTGRAVERLDAAIAANPETVELRIVKLVLLERRVDAGAGKAADIEAISKTYRELFDLQPENALHRLALADFHRRHGDLEEAQSVLRRAVVEEGVGTPHAAARLVRLVREDRGFEAAVAELEALMRQNPDDAALRFLLADLYASEGHFDAAEAELTAIADSEEGQGATADDAQAAIARIRLAAGDEGSARELAEQVLAANRDHRVANLVLGTILLHEGKFDDAVRRARTALRERPDWVPGLRLAADAHLAAGETELAIDTLRRVARLDPADAASAERLARLLAAQGNYSAALKFWDQVAQLSDDPATALRARAELQMRQGNLSAAGEEIERLLDIPGSEPAGTLMAGDLLLLQGRFDESRSWFSKAAEMMPETSQPVLGLTRSYVAEGDPEAAIAYLEERVQAHPDDAVAFNLMGVVLDREGRLDEAETAFREAIALRPDWLEPYRRLGRALLEGGEPAKAVDVYRGALEHEPDDPNVLNELALAYYSAGDHEAAADTYRHLLQLRPDLERAAFGYAAVVALFLHDQPEQLERAFEIADARFRASDKPSQLDLLGWLHYRKGDFTAALPLLERAVGLAPDEPEYRYHLGMALARSGSKERAFEQLEHAVAGTADYPGLSEARTTYEELKSELDVGSDDTSSGSQTRPRPDS